MFENVKEDFMDVVSKNMEKEYSNFENDEFVDFSRGGGKTQILSEMRRKYLE